MEGRRKLAIGEAILKEALSSEEKLNALTLVLTLKARYVNSAMYEWSYRNIMKLCHCSFAQAKKALTTAMNLGWIVERETKAKMKYIVANKISYKKEKAILLFVASRNDGFTIYFERRNGNIKQVELSEESKKVLRNIKDGMRNPCETKQIFSALNKFVQHVESKAFRKSYKQTKPQTFSEIRQFILMAVLLKRFNLLQKGLNTRKSKSMSVTMNRDELFWEEYKKHGVSYKKLAGLFNGLMLTRYQIANLVSKMKKAGLIKVKQAKDLWYKVGEEETWELDVFMRYNEEKQKAECILNRCWSNKRKDPYSYYLYNAYIFNTDVIINRKRR